MDIDAIKAKNLLAKTSCYDCAYYGVSCYAIINNIVPDTLRCREFEFKKEIDAESLLNAAIEKEMKSYIDRMVIEKVNKSLN